MAGEVQVALIAAGSALLGGTLAAIAGSRVERLKYKSTMMEQAELRKVDAVQRFAGAATAWFEWLGAIKTNRRLTRAELLNENNARSRERQQAYRHLRLFCSDEMNHWLSTVYEPAERDLLDHYAWPMVNRLIEGQDPPYEDLSLPDGAEQVRRRYESILREEMTARFREEVTDLREPWRHWRPLSRRSRPSSR